MSEKKELDLSKPFRLKWDRSAKVRHIMTRTVDGKTTHLFEFNDDPMDILVTDAYGYDASGDQDIVNVELATVRIFKNDTNSVYSVVHMGPAKEKYDDIPQDWTLLKTLEVEL